MEYNKKEQIGNKNKVTYILGHWRKIIGNSMVIVDIICRMFLGHACYVNSPSDLRADSIDGAAEVLSEPRTLYFS